MSDSTFTTIRKALQTAARGVAPFSTTTSQVVLGKYNWAANTDFFANIVTTGPWLYIKPTGPGEADGQTFNGEFQLHADLVYGFANDAAYDWTVPDDLIATLVKAFVSYAKFVLGNALGAFRVSWDEPETRDDLKPVVARTVFTITGKFVADQVI